MKTKLSTIVLFAYLALAFLSIPVAHAGLAQIGPINPVSGFPEWYMDENGVALEPCLDGVARCASTPVIPGNPASVAAGFGIEAFYQLVTPEFPLGANGEDLKGTLVGLELAWNTASGVPLAGRQMVFSRLRLTVDKLTVGGIYTFVTPWGSVRIPAVAKPTVNGPFLIDFTDDDIGLPATGFAAPLTSPNIGPFLKATTPPVGFVGNGATPVPFTGGINGNLFQLLSPAGAVISTTRRATLVGKLATKGGLQQVSATYSRTAAGSGTVNVTAQSIGGQRIIATGVGATPARLLAQPGNIGQYAALIPFAAGATFSPLTVVNQTDARVPKPSVVINPVVDVVTLTSATFSTGTQTLTVRATSSDLSTAAPPVLRVVDAGTGTVIGPIRRGVFTLVTPLRPIAVRVISNKGGRANLRVTVIP